VKIETAAALVPQRPSFASLRRAASTCRACPLWKRATQTVFGEGPATAEIFLLGEQPGDQEDHQGRPFVGPAGHLLDSCLERAGIDRSRVYVTNVVKHFKWEPRGKKRIHQKPNSEEIAACRPWLEAELALIQPKALICLGATAAQAIFGPSFRVTRSRGTFLPSPLAPLVSATVHPSAVLRSPDPDTRQKEEDLLVRDLARVARALKDR
jgi:DNA polymerase